MQVVKVDALRAEPRDYLPATVRTLDGEYAVLGIVVAQTMCNYPADAQVSDGGRRLLLLLGERVVDPSAEPKAAGSVATGSGV